MAELTVHKGSENRQMPAREWDPFRWAREMLGFEPFRTPMAWPQVAGYLPDFDVKETKEGLLFKADLPGVKESDVEVTLTGNRLTIAGKREAEKEEKTEAYYMSERSFGSFTRVFTLPGEIEAPKVHAELKNGVLTVLVPHAPNALPKKIAVKS